MVDLEQACEQFKPVVSKLAYKNWQRLSGTHKHWIDPEDFVQEGMLHMALVSVPSYRDDRKAKILTWVYTTVQNQFNTLVDRTEVQARRGELIRLDAPLDENSSLRREPIAPTNELSAAQDRVNALLGDDISDSAYEVIRDQILGRRPKKAFPEAEVLLELRTLCDRHGVTSDDFRLLQQHAEVADSKNTSVHLPMELGAIQRAVNNVLRRLSPASYEFMRDEFQPAVLSGRVKLNPPAGVIDEVQALCQENGLTLEHWQMALNQATIA